MKRHVVLVGLPGSGKSTVARLAALQLHAAVSDTDAIVTSVTARTIAAVFAELGEAEFRKLERAAMTGALAAAPHIIAPGAGWIAQRGNLEAAAGALLLYLRVAPEVAAARLSAGEERPLVSSGDPVARMTALFDARESWYTRAEGVVDAMQPVEEVARQVVGMARDRAGW